jgi:hypothetical protein
LLDDWYDEHLAGFADVVKPRLLRRAAAARLAQMCLGGRAGRAAEQLGIPREATINALNVVKHELPRPRRRAFDNAVDTLADHLGSLANRIDFGRRREALDSWVIPADEWKALIDGLPAQPVVGIARSYIDWGDSKRLLASMWVWVQITGGEHIFAPAIRPNPNEARPGGATIWHIHSRLSLISAEQPTGHYTTLRERLHGYVTGLANAIDNPQTLTRDLPPFTGDKRNGALVPTIAGMRQLSLVGTHLHLDAA